MFSLVVRVKPLSYNSNRKHAYQQRLRHAFRMLHPESHPLRGDLYGMVIYFQKRRDDHDDPDADNISKPVWDALSGLAFPDDKALRLRHSGVYTLSGNTAFNIHEHLLDDRAFEAFTECLESRRCRHFMLIVVAQLRDEHYPFSLSLASA